MRNTFFICVMVVLFVNISYGQISRVDSLRTAYDKMYGLDVLLNNGRKFFPDNNPAKGHPFWISQEPYEAALSIAGKKFKNQQIQYNLYKQEFVLTYKDYKGQNEQIVLNPDVIDTLWIGKECFVPNTFQEIASPFIQLIYESRLSCVVAWSKELQFNRTGANTGYEFTSDAAIYYLIMNHVPYRFNNKTSFIKIFPKASRAKIKKYMTTHHFKFKRMEHQVLSELINYCEETVL